MSKPIDTAAHIHAQIEHTEFQINDAKSKGMGDLVALYASHVANLRDVLAKVRMLPCNVAPIVSLMLQTMEHTRHQTRSEPPPYTLNDDTATYTLTMNGRGEISIYCDAMAKPENWRNLNEFARAYPRGAHDGFESAMVSCGLRIGAMATHETEDGQRVYNNEHIQWMFEQWHRAQ